MDKGKMKRNIQKARLLIRAVKWFSILARDEFRRGTLLKNMIGVAKTGEIAEEMSWGELLEERAAEVPNKVFLLYNDERLTYAGMNQNANRLANYLLSKGGGRGKGIGIFMRNSPRYIDAFIGPQKIGMYIVPINAELKGDGLQYLINHSDIEFLLVDAELYEVVNAVRPQLTGIKHIIYNNIEPESKEYQIPDNVLRLSDAYAPGISADNPGIGYNRDDKCVIMYTSGTTGRAKGVVYTYAKSKLKRLSVISGIFVNKNDTYFTPLPLFHANALFLTVTFAMSVRGTAAITRKFSARRFWEEVRKYRATIFNTIGSMIPIFMKQPANPLDNKNDVKVVLSAACPADMWEAFENRFGVTIYEGYGGVDTGGKVIMNLGTAPVGSIGKPPKGIGKYKIVDENGNDVPPCVPGELMFQVSKKKGGVDYYKNTEASDDKVKDGWLRTGDLIRKDEDGYLYFVGRNTESMRKGGENVSAYEVEHVIMEHPAVEEVAVYAVPSELAEDEIMASIKLVEGLSLTPAELSAFLQDKLAKFAIPRYVRVVTEFPMTSTHRIQKKELEKLGVTPDTWDAKK